MVLEGFSILSEVLPFAWNPTLSFTWWSSSVLVTWSSRSLIYTLSKKQFSTSYSIKLITGMMYLEALILRVATALTIRGTTVRFSKSWFTTVWKAGPRKAFETALLTALRTTDYTLASGFDIVAHPISLKSCRTKFFTTAGVLANCVRTVTSSLADKADWVCWILEVGAPLTYVYLQWIGLFPLLSRPALPFRVVQLTNLDAHRADFWRCAQQMRWRQLGGWCSVHASGFLRR